jgi:hypothetical protein
MRISSRFHVVFDTILFCVDAFVESPYARFVTTMRLVSSKHGGSPVSSPFSQTLNRKDFLAIKQPKSPSIPSTPPSRTKNLGQNVDTGPSFLKSNNICPKSPRERNDERQVEPSGCELGYEELLAGLPEAFPASSSKKNSSKEDMNSGSAHAANPPHKPKVRFGDVKLRKLLDCSQSK